MNFRNEREHDEGLIELIRNLDQKERLDVLETSLGLPTLGRLNNAQRRRAFDVELEFRQRRLLVETKVDSDERGRWKAIDDAAAWQTNRIAAQARDGDVCLFITYGFAEFFTKWFDFGAAAGPTQVRHVKLDNMIDLLAKAAPILNSQRVSDWLTALQVEQQKRRAMPAVLSAFAKFRRTYLQIAGEVDFTPTRTGFNSPEIAFPAFAQFLGAWRASPYCQRYGRLSIYPVNRLMLPVDSILNWFELWRDLPALTVGGILPAEMRALYFEVNEDFNLHLKLISEADDHVNQVRAEVARRLGSMVKPAALVACRPEFHQQQVYAIWEWDVDFPALIYEDSKGAVKAIGSIFDSILPQLA
jgi:hypothetical protein